MGLWWALLLGACLAIGWYAARKDWFLSNRYRVLVCVMLGLGIVGPLLIALNPVWVQPVPPPPGKPTLTVLVDATQSMATPDGNADGTQSRWRASLDAVSKLPLDHQRVDIRVQSFADKLTPLNVNTPNLDQSVPPADSTSHRSDLTGAIRQTVRSGSSVGHAILLVSDGAHNVGSVDSLVAAAQEAKSVDTPIYSLTVGSSVGIRNVSVSARTPRMIAFANHPLILRFRIGHSGMTDQTVNAQLWYQNKVIASQKKRLSRDPMQEIKFTLDKAPTELLARYSVSIEPVEGEATEADNQSSVLVQKLGAPIRVLLLEGKPYWDSKFLCRNLTADPTVDLSCLIQMTSSRYLVTRYGSSISKETSDSAEVGSSSLPEGVWSIDKELHSPLEQSKALDEFRVVIVGRNADPFLTDKAVENLRNWVSKNGGCLLCARGAPSLAIAKRLADVMPVKWENSRESRFRSSVSQYGYDAAVFDPLISFDGADPLADMPSLATSSSPKAREGLPQVLAQSVVDDSGKAIPVVSYQSYGSGQTVVIEGSGMWRWAFLPPQHAAKDSIYPTLWQAMIQWIISQQDLLPGQKVAIRSDRNTFLTGDRVTATLMTPAVKDVADTAKSSSADASSAFEVLLSGPGLQLPRRLQVSPWGMDSDLFKVDFGVLDVGYYTASVVSTDSDKPLAETVLEVRDPWFEKLEVDARPDLMRRLSLASGGTPIEASEVGSIVARFEERLQANRPVQVIRKSVWDQPLVLLGVLGVWACSWVIRRRTGLV